MPQRRALALFIALSLLTHLAVWLLMPRARMLPLWLASRPLELTLLLPRLRPVSAVGPQSPRERSAPARRPAPREAPPEISAAAPPLTAPISATPSGAPRRIAAPGLAAVPIVEAPPSLQALPPARETSPPAWVKHDLDATLAARAGPRGALVELAQKLTQTLSPDSTRVSKVRASASQLAAVLAATTRPLPTENITEDLVPGARDMRRLVREREVGEVCLGHCGQKHDISHISAVVHFDHDEAGRVQGWRMELPSGNKVFDTKVAAQAEAMCGLALASVAADRVPVWSEWRIAETGYRWGPIERALDPLFRPPGKRDAASSDVLGLSTVFAEVVLVAVVYRAER